MEHTPLSPLGSPQARQDYSPSISVLWLEHELSPLSYGRYMHQGFEDEKGMAPAFDEAPGHTTTDSTSSGRITRLRLRACQMCAGHTWKLQLPDPSSCAAFVRLMTYQCQLPCPSEVALVSSIGHACSLQRARSTSGAAETREPHGRQLTNRNTSLPLSSAFVRQGGLPRRRGL